MAEGVELQGDWVANRGNPERDVCGGGAGTDSIGSFGNGRFMAVPVGSRQRIAVAFVTRPISASTWRS